VAQGTNQKEDKMRNAFLQELASVCRKHGLSISHEDSQGAFMIVEYDASCEEWLMNALWYASGKEER